MTRRMKFVWSAALSVVAASLPAQAGEKKVALDDVPAAVKQAILAKVGGGKLVDIGTYEDAGRQVFEIEMVVAGKEYDVVFDGVGKVVRSSFEGDKPAAAATPAAVVPKAKAKGQDDAIHQDDFHLEDRKLATTGRSRYFVLEPGYQLVLEGDEGGHKVRLTITVLEETRMVGGFDTRVVEERETKDEQVVEVSRNYFAICTETHSVFYFGEDVDIYENGKVALHGGAWLHGAAGARAGMMMPGEPLLGAAYQQEVAPEVAMDRARVVAVDATVATPAGIWKGCLKIQEDNPLDQDKEFKLHAPGIGLVQDENLVLVRHGFLKTR